MEPQILMRSGERDLLLASHDFYIEQVKARVLSNFDNIEKEADRLANEVYERFGPETAHDSGLEFYILLRNMKTQTSLGAIASLYHQWEKDFRGFMERQISGYDDQDRISGIKTLYDTLEQFGWPIRQAQCFHSLNSCRLIVNVYKHGKGSSLDELFENYPQYLKGPFNDIAEACLLTTPRHEDLAVTDEEFDQIAEGIRQFWVDFPERLFLAA